MAGITFQDRNFRLACLDVLLDRGYFADELRTALAIEVPGDEYEPSAARWAVLERIEITQQHLDEIETFAPDGGDDIYSHVLPNWSGEEDSLYIASFADLHLLRRLRRLSVHAVVIEGALDLADVCRLTQLESLYTFWFYINPDDENAQRISELKERGVSVEIDGTPD